MVFVGSPARFVTSLALHSWIGFQSQVESSQLLSSYVYPYGYCVMLVIVVHRHHSWVGPLAASVPWKLEW